MEAQFKHDCGYCVLVSVTEKADIYVCPHKVFPNLVIRYGNEGPDYYSDMVGFNKLIEEYISKTPIGE